MNSLSRIVRGVLILMFATAIQPLTVLACLWDSDTLIEERITNPKMASAIFDKPPKPDVRRLRERIATLEAARREDDPAWWNDLAGAHIRLGETEKAVSLLEPLLKRFPKDYGIHANLGTAYHLLGRYGEAEREIARDLKINPKAHFGLERYHLALLQYLTRDEAYRKRHLYVDEWTYAFLMPGRDRPRVAQAGTKLPASHQNSKADAGGSDLRSPAAIAKEIKAADIDPNRVENLEMELLAGEALRDTPPPYRYRWDLAREPNFLDGVLYMTSLNRDEPACWAMLGWACMIEGDLHLGIAALERAGKLQSPQREILELRIQNTRRFIRESGPSLNLIAAVLIAVVLGGVLWGMIATILWVRRRMRRGTAA